MGWKRPQSPPSSYPCLGDTSQQLRLPKAHPAWPSPLHAEQLGLVEQQGVCMGLPLRPVQVPLLGIPSLHIYSLQRCKLFKMLL